MSKRNQSFDRVSRDYYPTIDPKAIPPNLLKHIRGKTYAEPFYGEGDLEDLLMDIATCKWRSDIRETVGCSSVRDALTLTSSDLEGCDITISNPPYQKDVLLSLIDHLVSLKPTWLLLPADNLHNGYMVPYMKQCERVISVGRLYFFENTWVVKEPFDYDELDKKWDKSVEFYDFTKGIKYYTGYLDSNGKPVKSKTIRGTDNFAWYLFLDHEVETIFEVRGD